MKNNLRIYVLGPPYICHGETSAVAFPTEKVKQLFYYLVVFRHTAHTREALAGLLWGDSPEESARHSLSTALWRLRKWFEALLGQSEAYLTIEDGHLAFNTSGPHWLDVTEFERQITLARQIGATNRHLAMNSLTRAVELYRGELLEDCYVDWCRGERDRLHHLFLHSLIELMEYHAKRREFVQAIAFAQRILNHDPLREDIHCELMKFYALNQQTAEALLQYRRCEAILREDLGIEPMPATREILGKLLGQSTGALPPHSHSADGNTANNTDHHLKALIHKLDAALTYIDAIQNELAGAKELLKQASGAILDAESARAQTTVAR